MKDVRISLQNRDSKLIGGKTEEEAFNWQASNKNEKHANAKDIDNSQCDNLDDEGDGDLIEDLLDSPGTIENALIHASAKRILKVPTSFDPTVKIEFCNDCFLPQETKGVIEQFEYNVDPREFQSCGYGVYLIFFFMKYLMVNLIGIFIICAAPFIYLTNTYSNELFTFCTEYYVNNTLASISPPETHFKDCRNFVATGEFDYTSFDWINRWSGETMWIYLKLIKEQHGQDRVDEIVTNFNLITFIGSVAILITNMVFINLSDALVSEIDFNEESPSDYSLLISDIPVEHNDPEELKNVFLANNTAKIHEINWTYQQSEIAKHREEWRTLKKLIKMSRLQEEVITGMLCWKKKFQREELHTKKQLLTDKIKEIESDQSKFNGVAFVTFASEPEMHQYYKQFPHSFMHKLISNWGSSFLLFACRCFLTEEKKRILKLKKLIAVSYSPEPEDILWGHLEYHFISRFIRSWLNYFISILCIGVSFGIVLGWNYVQFNAERDFENHLILKYGISLSITAVISWINFIMSTLFTILANREKPWSYTEWYWSMSIKLTWFTFVNSAIVPWASNAIQYGWDSNEVLVNNMWMLFLCGSIVGPLVSLTSYDLLLKRAQIWWFERSHPEHVKNPTMKIQDKTQRELNELYENPAMGVSVQYSNLSKQILMAMFYFPIFPMGIPITFAGIALNYWVEKWKCIWVYKKPEMLNQEMCFFYINYFTMALFVLGIGNYVFFANTHSFNGYEWIVIILYPILTVISYHDVFRICDSSTAYSKVNNVKYDDAYFTFSFDYERMNPNTQRTGVWNYLSKLEKFGFITKEMLNKLQEKISNINIMELFYFSQQTSKMHITAQSNEQGMKLGEINMNMNMNNPPVNGISTVEGCGLNSCNKQQYNQINTFFNNLNLMDENTGGVKLSNMKIGNALKYNIMNGAGNMMIHRNKAHPVPVQIEIGKNNSNQPCHTGGNVAKSADTMTTPINQNQMDMNIVPNDQSNNKEQIMNLNDGFNNNVHVNGGHVNIE